MNPKDVKEIINQIRENLNNEEVTNPLFIHLEVLFEELTQEIEILSKTNMKLFFNASKKALQPKEEE